MISENDACLKNLRIVQQLLVNISSGIQFLIKYPRKKIHDFLLCIGSNPFLTSSTNVTK